MAIRTLLRFGNETLVTASKPVVSFNTKMLEDLVNDLTDTMHQFNGVGIAAPQIGVPLRVIVFGFETNPRYPHAKPVPYTVLINPEIECLNNEAYEDWEGCLSLTGIRGLVTRYKNIRYRGYDLSGNLIEREVSGFHAKLLQHEVDHLNGVLFPSRIKNLKYFGFEDEMIEWRKTIGEKLD